MKYKVLTYDTKQYDMWFDAIAKNDMIVAAEFETFEEAEAYGNIHFNTTEVWAIDDGR